MKLTLRLPDDLYEKLKVLADKEHRSLNAQIVFFLESNVELLGVFGHQVDTTETPPPAERPDTQHHSDTNENPPLDVQDTPPDKATVHTGKPLCTCTPAERVKGKHEGL